MAGLILDAVAGDALQGQIIEEGLANPRGERSSFDREVVTSCLQSILLCGPAIIFRQPRELAISVEDLRRIGICELADPLPNSYPIRKGQTPSLRDVKNAVEEVRFLKHFTRGFLYRVLKKHMQAGEWMADIFGADYRKLGYYRTRRIVEALPELAFYHALGAWWKDIDLSAYPEEAICIIDAAPLIDESLIPIILLLANEPRLLISESNQRGLPILSPTMRIPAARIRNLHPQPPIGDYEGDLRDPLQLVRLSLFEAGLDLPRIQTISQLQDLMDDPRVVSFRSLITRLTASVAEADAKNILDIRSEAMEAAGELRKLSRRTRRLRWVGLLPVATSVAEAMLGMFPMASAVATLGLTSANLTIKRKEKRHRWLWLLPRRGD